jgi:choline dehydrogenase-like flavoprotein
VKSSGVLFERGARALGLHPQPTPLCILSRPYNGRNSCQHCGFCLAFGCEHNAKSSTLVTTIPAAEATRRCEVRSGCYAARVETDARGRATGVTYFDSDRRFNGNCFANGVFDEPLNEHKSVAATRMVWDFYDTDPARGFYGGGGMDARSGDGGVGNYPMMYAIGTLPPGVPTWGAEYKRALRDGFTRTMGVAGHTTSLPVPTNRVELDPELRDEWGLPCMRITYRDHDDDLAMMRFFTRKGKEILDAAGARASWENPVVPTAVGFHLLGTCRMGSDPRTSVVDRFHRTHDVRNLFLCDGSSFVTSGRGQPTATIQALAYRAGEHIARFARRGEI